jgi:Amt family ammonium transporter
MGALLTGLLASSGINAVFGRNALGNPLSTGAIDGNWRQVINQAIGVGIGWGFSILGTLLLLFLVDRFIGLRVSTSDENIGLDLTQHNEEGYDLSS